MPPSAASSAPVIIRVPTPQAAIFAPCCLRLAITCSSSSLEAKMTVFVNPAASSSLRASMESQARSPESRRMPDSSRPCERSHLPVSIALRTPRRES